MKSKRVESSRLLVVLALLLLREAAKMLCCGHASEFRGLFNYLTIVLAPTYYWYVRVSMRGKKIEDRLLFYSAGYDSFARMLNYERKINKRLT